MQAAVGCAQLRSLENSSLRGGPTSLASWRRCARTRTGCSCPYAPPTHRAVVVLFRVTVRDNAGFTRDELIGFLEANRVETRSLFGGNLCGIPRSRHHCRVVGDWRHRRDHGAHILRRRLSRGSTGRASSTWSTCSGASWMESGSRTPPTQRPPTPGWLEGTVAVVRKISCSVTGVVDHGAHVFTVELRPSTPVPRFKPGQFLHLALDGYEPVGFWPDSRVFSIASPPLERERLEITYAVKGAFTARMERELSVGRQVWLKLPYGEFVVDATRDAVLFAGGTGVTAFTAFLQSLEGGDGAARAAVLRRPDLRPLHLRLAGRGVRLCGAFSCLHPRTRGLCGVLDVATVWPAIEPLDEPLFYLSGPPQMLTALTAQLSARGVRQHRISTDAWE